ncbi:PREDICTED: uncharacterized protein LOC105312697 isoform X1 [Amphimedon queenslandica]|uniref:Glycine N-acyltransferase-like protein n=1 Tax=Amphimedon queenslandica TaxID=400682 RepID=A0AAN0J501_AMPQE|nr:PREDICTED: uncharacterized protein LOC105312697 isoform X1 [Amphimedon queenslandica]|eukprot:XP_019851822.1 PREDICTED: uncharacterized protein LOC105312697 isoform X1 [Amphimedon queenslandica]
MMADHKIAIEADANKREELKGFLYKYWPDTIEILHGLRLGKDHNAKILIDNWPDVKTVILTYDEGETTFVFSFGTDDSKTASILKSVIDSQSNDSHQILINGFEVFQEMKKLNIDTNCAPFFRYVYTPGAVIERPTLPEGYKIDIIHLSDIEFVVSKWGVAKGSLKMNQLMRHFITNYPNVAIYDTSIEPPRLVSWNVSSAIGCLYHFFTAEEHRGKGLGTIVKIELLQKILTKGFTPFCYIYADDAKAQTISEKVGFVRGSLYLRYIN